jgi:large exoprotein involved in heme utilization and adhesion
MMRISRKLPLGAAVGAAMLAAGGFGYALFTPGSSGAQTTTTVPAAGGATTPGSGAFHSNEDPTHEKGESAQREADENSGKAFAGRGPGGRFKPNEDPTHEKSESAQREAQEKAGGAPTTP